MFSSKYFKYRALQIAFAILLYSVSSKAQELHVSAVLDSNNIKIGKQSHIILKAIASKGISVVFPEVKDSLTSHVELLSSSKIDTVSAGNKITYQQKLVITAFDSGYFPIPPFAFTIKGDSSKKFETEALLFVVQTVPVDTTQAIKSIKGPITPAWSIFEIQNEILAALLIILLVIALFYYLKHRKKTIIETPAEPVITKPADEIALEALQKLREQKLWQQGKVKEYHIIISDTIRAYLERKFSVGAMEMTSDEILKSVRLLITDQPTKSKLKSVLILSDMVKFAKEVPLPLENEASIDNAIEFVKLTTIPLQKEDLKV